MSLAKKAPSRFAIQALYCDICFLAVLAVCYRSAVFVVLESAVLVLFPIPERWPPLSAYVVNEVLPNNI